MGRPFIKRMKTGLLAAAFSVSSTFGFAGMLFSATARAEDAPNWELVAGSKIDFLCSGQNYVHTLLNVSQEDDGSFTGNGHYDTDTSYTWDATGNVAGDVLTMHIVYTGTASGSEYHLTNGMIAPDGSVAGTADSFCESFTMPAGSLTAIEEEPEPVVSEVDVYGNTAAGENQPGWLFNRDASTSNPYVFNAAQASIGAGSLYVQPIGATPANKFIAENFINKPVADVDGVSFDIRVGAGGSAASANQFYMNVYANFGSSNDLKFYDCRYNVVATTVSNSAWTTVSFDPTQSYPVTTRGGSDPSPFSFPAVPADMDTLSAGSNIRMFALNLGDTTASDVGIDGFFDKVVVSTATEVTTYDFEPVSGKIVKPSEGKHVSGWLKLKATYNDGDQVNDDAVQWAVRKGTCAASTGTVLGNVDGKNDPFQWDGATFKANLDIRAMEEGEYCFVFNPTDDAGQLNVRETRNFFIDAFVPETLKDCLWGGWKDYLNPSFRNQGQCVKYVIENTEKPRWHKKKFGGWCWGWWR